MKTEATRERKILRWTSISLWAGTLALFGWLAYFQIPNISIFGGIGGGGNSEITDFDIAQVVLWCGHTLRYYGWVLALFGLATATITFRGWLDRILLSVTAIQLFFLLLTVYLRVALHAHFETLQNAAASF